VIKKAIIILTIKVCLKVTKAPTPKMTETLTDALLTSRSLLAPSPRDSRVKVLMSLKMMAMASLKKKAALTLMTTSRLKRRLLKHAAKLVRTKVPA
jgi:hypothetical protein